MYLELFSRCCLITAVSQAVALKCQSSCQSEQRGICSLILLGEEKKLCLGPKVVFWKSNSNFFKK